MQSITDKLSDVVRRIAEGEERIDEQLHRLRNGSCEQKADAAMQLYCCVTSVQELRAYQARLEELGAKPPDPAPALRPTTVPFRQLPQEIPTPSPQPVSAVDSSRAAKRRMGTLSFR
jgi:hypothetical protein